jgi:hypothetical protein
MVGTCLKDPTPRLLEYYGLERRVQEVYLANKGGEWRLPPKCNNDGQDVASPTWPRDRHPVYRLEVLWRSGDILKSYVCDKTS